MHGHCYKGNEESKKDGSEKGVEKMNGKGTERSTMYRLDKDRRKKDKMIEK